MTGWRGQFLLLAAIWGSSFLFIKVGVQALAPLQVTLGRLVLGAAVLLAALALRRERLPRDPRLWGHLAVAALLANTAAFTLFAYGEQTVSSVVAGIWNATTPLLTLVVAMAAMPEERPTRARAGGLLVGFLGVLVVLGIWRGLGGASLAGNLLCCAAAACYGVAAPYQRRLISGRPESGLALAAAQLLAGVAQLAVLTALFTDAPPSVPARALAGVAALGVLGTGVAYLFWYGVLRAAGATVASSVTYLIPVVSTLLGVVVLHEELVWNQPVGALIIVVGVALSQGLLRVGSGQPHPADRVGDPADS